MINSILFLAYEMLFYLLLITSINILLLLYISWVFPYITKKIKICGGPRDSVKIRSSSWSAKVCPGLLYTMYNRLLFQCHPCLIQLPANVKKIELSRNGMQVLRGRGVQLLLILDLGTRPGDWSPSRLGRALPPVPTR
jgi:hypothetical protein